MKVAKIVKGFCIAVLILFFVAILFRIFMLDDKRVLKDIYPTEGFVTAYEKNGENAFSYHKMSSQISTDGYYTAYAMVYCESAQEVQLTVRYNDSLTERYLPGTSAEMFRWELVDENGTTVSVGQELESVGKYQYNYIRVSFEDVKIEEDTSLLLRLYCDEADYPTEGSEPEFMVHVNNKELKKYSLSSAEKKLLAEGK